MVTRRRRTCTGTGHGRPLGGHGRPREATALVNLEGGQDLHWNRPREATGGQAGGHRLVTWRLDRRSSHWDRPGRPREATGGHRLVTWRAGQYPPLGQGREATEGHGRPWGRPQVGNLEGWTVSSTGTGSGGHGRPWEATGNFFFEGNLEAEGYIQQFIKR